MAVVPNDELKFYDDKHAERFTTNRDRVGTGIGWKDREALLYVATSTPEIWKIGFREGQVYQLFNGPDPDLSMLSSGERKLAELGLALYSHGEYEMGQLLGMDGRFFAVAMQAIRLWWKR